MFHGSTADCKILETISQRLQRSSFWQLKLIAAVNRGTVAIAGRLQYEGQRDSILKALRGSPGVRQVLDRLQVSPSAEDQQQSIYCQANNETE